MTWVDSIIKAFRNLGGEASYDELYAELGRLKDRLLIRRSKRPSGKRLNESPAIRTTTTKQKTCSIHAARVAVAGGCGGVSS
jgi:hypothetical protein